MAEGHLLYVLKWFRTNQKCCFSHMIYFREGTGSDKEKLYMFQSDLCHLHIRFTYLSLKNIVCLKKNKLNLHGVINGHLKINYKYIRPNSVISTGHFI